MAPDISRIELKLAQLRVQFPHAGMFCHFTEMANLKNILEAGALLSRNAAVQRGHLKGDTAAQHILDRTPCWVHDCARLYFAPKTPMLHNVEGLKRPGFLDDWPQCPRPIYLQFHPRVLCLEGVRVSTGNMAADHADWHEMTLSWFENLPFDGIYHRGRLPPDHDGDEAIEYKRMVVYERQAEVLVPDELPLAHLERIVFRTPAERHLAETWFRCGALLTELPVAVDPLLFNIHDGGRRVAVSRFVDGRIEVLGGGLQGVTLRAWRSSGGSDLHCRQCTFDRSRWSDWSEWEASDIPTQRRFEGVIYTFDAHLKPMAVSAGFGWA